MTQEKQEASPLFRPLVSVDILPFMVEEKKLKILLVKRNRSPFEGSWALPGGFLLSAESAEEAAGRKLKEETGVENAHLEQLYTFSAPERDPRERVISIAYLALAPKLSFDAKEASLFQIQPEDRLEKEGGGLPLSFHDLAFDHGDILRVALMRMQGKLYYSDIALSLVGDRARFTLPELQEVYEAILSSPLDAGNFYRRMKRDYVTPGKIVPTGEFQKYPGKKRAALYRAT
ncbi:MAG: NUDIX hydrolase [Blautia sp.]|nr:NUDIX hydrolase [Blautia sp.]